MKLMFGIVIALAGWLGFQNSAPHLPQPTTMQVNPIAEPPHTNAFASIAPGTALGATADVNPSSTDFSRIRIGYFHNGSAVFYVVHGVVHDLPSADLQTFETLTGSITDTEPYALDKNHVYYTGKAIVGANPLTFHVLNGFSYAVDEHGAYWQGTAIPNADAKTFVAGNVQTDLTAATDKNHLYCSGQAYPLSSSTCTTVNSTQSAASATVLVR